jgi:hypothetical protein
LIQHPSTQSIGAAFSSPSDVVLAAVATTLPITPEGAKVLRKATPSVVVGGGAAMRALSLLSVGVAGKRRGSRGGRGRSRDGGEAAVPDWCTGINELMGHFKFVPCLQGLKRVDRLLLVLLAAAVVAAWFSSSSSCNQKRRSCCFCAKLWGGAQLLHQILVAPPSSLSTWWCSWTVVVKSLWWGASSLAAAAMPPLSFGS